MKFLTFLLIILLVLVYRPLAQADGYKSFRINQIGLEAGIKKSAFGNLFRIGISKHLTDKAHVKFAPFLEKCDVKKSRLSSMGADLGLSYIIYPISDNLRLNCSGGITGNYDEVENFSTSTSRTLNAGIWGGVEIERSLTDQILLLATGNQRLLLKSNMGRQRYDYGIGIKIILND